MERNLTRRIEVLCPIHDSQLRRRMRHTILAAYLKDNARTHLLQSDGTYRATTGDDGVAPFSAQDFLLSHPAVLTDAPDSEYELGPADPEAVA
jgi:polyphosphate kinase